MLRIAVLGDHSRPSDSKSLHGWPALRKVRRRSSNEVTVIEDARKSKRAILRRVGTVNLPKRILIDDPVPLVLVAGRRPEARNRQIHHAVGVAVPRIHGSTKFCRSPTAGNTVLPARVDGQSNRITEIELLPADR